MTSALYVATAVLVAVVGGSSAVTNEVTYIIDSVNNDPDSTWEAGYDNVIPGNELKFSQLMGILPRESNAFKLAPIKEVENVDVYNLPERFDSRERWPECISLLGSIKDQSNCGSCWAVSSASVLSDRLCIASGGAVAKNLSAEHLNNCCYRCGFGCDGGIPEQAWYFMRRHGIVTGGDYGSSEGCQPYTIYPCSRKANTCIDIDPDTPVCTVKSCTNPSYKRDYKADLHYAKTVYSLDNSELDIMVDIYRNGPVQANFHVYTDFMYYRKGVYSYKKGELEGGHGVKIIGWGVENGTKYWLCVNSWGKSWGENGRFKILKGKNECRIEQRVVAGLPRVPKRLS